MKRYHVVGDKLTMKADAMLAGLKERGFEYEIVSRTGELAKIEIKKSRAKAVTFELSWESAQKETFPYAGKPEEVIKLLASGGKPKIKDKYATPHSRMQMLWARVVSDAVRAVCPEVNYGTYTPEEMGDVIDGEVIPQREEPAARPQAQSQPQSQTVEKPKAEPVKAAAPTPTTAVASPPADIPFKPADHAPLPKGNESGQDLEDHAKAKAERITRIQHLVGQLKIQPAEWKEKMQKNFGFPSVRDCTLDQMDAVIRGLEKKVNGAPAGGTDEMSKFAAGVQGGASGK
jgi:hypothetical protein